MTCRCACCRLRGRTTGWRARRCTRLPSPSGAAGSECAKRLRWLWLRRLRRLRRLRWCRWRIRWLWFWHRLRRRLRCWYWWYRGCCWRWCRKQFRRRYLLNEDCFGCFAGPRTVVHSSFLSFSGCFWRIALGQVLRAAGRVLCMASTCMASTVMQRMPPVYCACALPLFSLHFILFLFLSLFTSLPSSLTSSLLLHFSFSLSPSFSFSSCLPCLTSLSFSFLPFSLSFRRRVPL